MPGIAGIIGNSDENVLLKRMIDRTNHFGYHTDHFSNNGIHLGISHLGHNSSRILVSDCKNHVLAFIGEIFSEGNPDNPVIQDAAKLMLDRIIQDPDLSFLPILNGHFSACYCDLRSKKVILISDRFGTRPVYYTVNKGRIVFSSEVKAILEDQINKTIDKVAVSHLFHFHHLYGYGTLFTEIKQLPESTYMVFEKGQLRQVRYWNIPENTEIYEKKKFSKIDINRYSEILENRMNNAMYRTFQNNRDSLLFSLSGGLDSRYVVAFARQFGVNPVLAYTIGPDNSEDQIYARQVADILDIKQRSYVAAPDTLWKDACRFSYFSDGMSTIQGPILSLSMLEEDYPKYQATITSQMCDAVFGSTLWRKKIKILLEKTSIDKESTSILFSIYNLSSDEQLKNIFTKEYYSDIKDTYKDVIQGYLNQGIKRPFHVYYHLMFNEHGRRGTLCGNLVHNLFVETRMPSYDNDLLEFAFNLPIALRQFQYLYRLVFTRKFPLLARVKREYYNLPISADNWRFNFKTWENKIITKLKETPLQAVFKNIKRYNRPKYVSYDYWFKNELKDQVKDILFDKRIINRGIYNPSGLEKLFSDHMNSSVDNSGLIWQIINLEYFYRRFID